MKVVIQRVSQAEVTVKEKSIGNISQGILAFLCVEKDDTQSQADYLADKILNLRIFEDNKSKMNLSVKDINGELLIVSQFTLSGDCTKGRRPSFEKSAEPKEAEGLYEYFIKKLKESNLKVESGIFKAMMDVHLVNDGPVTFILETKNKDK
ncbi:MAG: D-tyrosyl-tRNA(Tyr) deacylase [Candidatus Omnitrophica bacterium]|nr:D-tyrosyl-tRNA(Tyr) deacylase [Candidatus Omnitrophota bacterium]